MSATFWKSGWFIGLAESLAMLGRCQVEKELGKIANEPHPDIRGLNPQAAINL